MTKTAFLSVVYPGAEKYLGDFFNSLCEQDYKRFDLVIVNDGLREFEKYFSLYNSLNINELKFSGTPAEVREFGIKHILAERYDVVVFGDSDDYFADNRISTAVQLLKTADIIANDLDIVSEKKTLLQHGYLSKRLDNGRQIKLEDILEKNFFGLSNTAVKTKYLDGFSMNASLTAVDWYLFSWLLAVKDANAVFTNETITFYRQHRRNIAGMAPLQKEDIIKQLRIKIRHFSEMRKFNALYEKPLEQYKKILQRISADPKELQAYYKERRKAEIKNPLWWELV